MQTKSQVGEAGIFELIVNPSDIEAEGAAENSGLGRGHLKCLPRAARRSIKRGVGFSRACVRRYRKRGGTEIGPQVTDRETQGGLAGSTQTIDVELHKSLVDKTRETGNKSPETGHANLRRHIVESINGAIAIEITQGKNMSRLENFSMGGN